MIEHAIPTTTHGRYLVVPAKTAAAAMLVGFHGYAEPAEMQMSRLQAIPGVDAWTTISIQGMHRFYQRRSDAVVASWMTRQDRELAIADNVAYISAIVAGESGGGHVRGVVYAGFSQGVAMAFRAAVNSAGPVLGVIAAGGDVPPELDRLALARVGHALLCRGTEDKWYTAAKFEQDQTRLREAGVMVTAESFEGGHEWADAVIAAAADFLRHRLR